MSISLQDAPLLAIPQVAEALAVSSTTVRRLISGGALPAVRVGGQLRVAPAELASYVFGSGGSLPRRQGGSRAVAAPPAAAAEERHD